MVRASEPFRPTFEYSGRPVVLSAVTAIVLAGVAILFLHRPAWILPIGFLAGGVAAAAGGYYDAPANNGFIGVLIALFPIYLFAFLYRVWFFTPGATDGDTLFFGAVLAVVDLVVYGPLMLLMAYLGGIVVDYLRRRFDAPLGY